MGTVPQPMDEGPSKTEQVTRVLIAGHPQAAVRRIVLYLLATTGVFLTLMLPQPLSGPPAILAALALMDLALTDQLV